VTLRRRSVAMRRRIVRPPQAIPPLINPSASLA
jgi:hypothetical protein